MDASSSSACSPLPSPTSSTGGQPATSNGHGARKGMDKVMRRNIDRVYFGAYDIKTWYYSPYPFDEEEWASMSNGSGSNLAVQQPSQIHRKIKAESRQIASNASTPTPECSFHRPGGALSHSAEKAPALQAMEIDAPMISRKDTQSPPANALWVCDGCFKYMRTYGGYTVHKKDCKQTHPPGRKVYQRGAHIVWEVDGAQEKLYAQNLCLFGKLFIDHKTIYFDVEPFTFYVLTDATSQFDHVLGYFSKEKVSYDDYNLACIITFPPFQKKGFGTLMIEFSYYLSSFSTILGTPERPLSDLGFKGYISYWSAVILRTLAICFYDTKTDVLLPASHSLYSPAKHKHSTQTAANNSAIAGARLRKETLRIRRILLGQTLPRAEALDSSTKSEDMGSEDSKIGTITAKRISKGWAGEVIHSNIPRSASELQKEATNEDLERSHIKYHGLASQVHPNDIHSFLNFPLEDVDQMVYFETTMERLSLATNIRYDDLCFAMADLGLLKWAKGKGSTSESTEGGEASESKKIDAGDIRMIVVHHQMIQDAIKENRIKRPVLDVNYVLIKPAEIGVPPS
ncbi:hypothetical protein CBS101457_005501 [Exobasidium rhododendri]|nr:hypothetical protein CBS101457_005501 [Exobasidium rhododendri]